MKLINQISDYANQTFNFTSDIGENINITLKYLSVTQCWIMDVTSGAFTITGLKLVNSINLLRQFRNVIDFGFAVVSDDLQDPFLLTDFSQGRSRLYLLNQADIINAEKLIKVIN